VNRVGLVQGAFTTKVGALTRGARFLADWTGRRLSRAPPQCVARATT
jgi:hypothetical protein